MPSVYPYFICVNTCFMSLWFCSICNGRMMKNGTTSVPKSICRWSVDKESYIYLFLLATVRFFLLLLVSYIYFLFMISQFMICRDFYWPSHVTDYRGPSKRSIPSMVSNPRPPCSGTKGSIVTHRHHFNFYILLSTLV